MRRWSLASALIAALLLLGSVHGQQPHQSAISIDGELLVKYSPGLTANQRTGILAGRGASRLRRFESVGVDHVRLPAGLSTDAAMAAFRRMSGVLAVQPNYRRRIIQNAPPPSDPFWLD